MEDSLLKSDALAAIWQRPLTVDQLQTEIDHMARDTRAPEGVPLRVTAGDVSLHITDVMHASMQPTDDLLDGEPAPERISLLLGFVRPDHANHLGKSHYNDVLLGNEGGQVEHLGDKLSSQGAP